MTIVHTSKLPSFLTSDGGGALYEIYIFCHAKPCVMEY